MAAELEYYKEQLAHGRHIEVQRSTVAGLALTVSGAIIGKLLENMPLGKEMLPYTITLIVVGLLSWLLSAKLYERFKLHNEIAKLARDKLDASLGALRTQAELTIKKKYFMYHVSLHCIWYALFALIASVGVWATWKIYYP